MAMMVYFAAGRLGSSRKMLLATIDTLAKPVTFLNVNVYGLLDIVDGRCPQRAGVHEA